MVERGHLRVYLGYAAGVGKTSRCWAKATAGKSAKHDVVVGFVETHGRKKTAAQCSDLEIMPRRKIVHKGIEFEEMDIDAILARNPRSL